jgi:acetyltransferase
MSYQIERYPTHMIDRWTLPGGRQLVVRPVLPQDADLEQAMVRALSSTARYQRFFSAIRELPAPWLEQMTQIDYASHMALIAESFEGALPVAVGEARYAVDASSETCEFAVVVAEGWQRQGIARRLLASLMLHARAAGLQHMEGDVLATNHAMLALAASLGFEHERHPEDARLVRTRIALAAPLDHIAPMPLAAGGRITPAQPVCY